MGMVHFMLLCDQIWSLKLYLKYQPWSATGLGLESGQNLESLQEENTPRLVPTTGSSSKIAQSMNYNHNIQYAKNEKIELKELLRKNKIFDNSEIFENSYMDKFVL